MEIMSPRRSPTQAQIDETKERYRSPRTRTERKVVRRLQEIEADLAITPEGAKMVSVSGTLRRGLGKRNEHDDLPKVCVAPAKMAGRRISGVRTDSRFWLGFKWRPWKWAFFLWDVPRMPEKIRVRGTAMIPPIPAEHRPKSLKDHMIVFEANWKTKSVDKDPALIKMVNRDVGVVVAEWDLTELEAEILSTL